MQTLLPSLILTRTINTDITGPGIEVMLHRMPIITDEYPQGTKNYVSERQIYQKYNIIVTLVILHKMLVRNTREKC